MYRAFYAIPASLKTRNGEQTNAVYGVASMLISLLKAEEPTHLLFCFDAGEETFRHAENATYKEGRAETPDEFFVQIPRIIGMIDTFGFKHVSAAKYEADDFLCTYAKAGEEAGMKVTIITGDRDALQLATSKVQIAIPHKAYLQPEYLGPEEILSKYGVRPDQIASYKGLTGDSSDNLPGVKGIGPKTAAELLQKYDTLAGVYEHLPDIKEGVRAKLEKDRESAFFCERMATLVCDIPLPVSVADLELKAMKAAEGLAVFQELEFNTLRRRMESLVASPYGQRHFEQLVTPVIPTKKTVSGKDQMSLF